MRKEDKIQEIINHIVLVNDYKDMCDIYGRQYRDELYQEFCLIIMEYKKVDKLYEIYQNKQLLYFCATIIKNMGTSNTSPFYKKIRGFSKSSTTTLDSLANNIDMRKSKNCDIHNKITSEDIQDDEEEATWHYDMEDMSNVYKKLSDGLNQIDEWFEQKEMEDPHYFYHTKAFQMYFYENMSYRTIGDYIGVNHISIFHSIKKTLEEIKGDLNIKGFNK